MALQADGWTLRQDIIWTKGNPMPESVNDRFTKNHEYVLLLSKSRNYYFDQDAVREPNLTPNRIRGEYHGKNKEGALMDGGGVKLERIRHETPSPLGRNKRSTWNINTSPSDWEWCKACETIFIGKERTAIKKVKTDGKVVKTCPCGANDWLHHFATFCKQLAEIPILAGSAVKACGKCGSPYKRLVERLHKTSNEQRIAKGDTTGKLKGIQNLYFAGNQSYSPVIKTVGFAPTCKCSPADNTGRSVVLDCFAGSGTSAIVAANNNRDFVGIDISEDYVKMAEKRIFRETQQLQLELS
jgi:adenine specific DNA methylase Mod